MGDVALNPAKFGTKASNARKEAAVVDSESNKSSHQKDGESSSASARTAKVTITSETTGAEIELDGQFVGSTPTALDIAEGVHKITVKNENKVWERSIRLSAGGAVTVNASFDNSSTPSPPSSSASSSPPNRLIPRARW